MPTVKFDRITLVQRLVSGCAVLFTTCALSVAFNLESHHGSILQEVMARAAGQSRNSRPQY